MRGVVPTGGFGVIVPAGLAFNKFMVVVIVVAALYFTRDILVPIALAVLLSFLLAPVVRTLQRWRLPKSLAVICAVVTALAVALSLAAMVMLEVNQLVNDLPRYQATLGSKVHNLRDAVAGPGLLKNASDLLKNLDEELSSEGRVRAGGSSTLAREQAAGRPMPVEVHQPAPGASETLVGLLRPLAAPFTTTAIVVVFLTFFLFQREDLRDRFIRLAGTGDLERTTAALDDAGHRLGRLFATQVLLNGCFGAIIGFGLAVIGVPSAPLWGLLAMILRFVPYIGAVLAAALPISLAAAVGDDWIMTLWTVALFAVVEPLTGHVAEPLVCGRSAGLSPVAIVLAASFWTWLWGPLGLILSTPLTLCLVVLARHVDRLQFLEIMLGDRPALTPQQAAYQRMLTGDPIEAIEQAHEVLRDKDVLAYYQEILLGALRLAQVDAERGRLDDVRLENIVRTVSEVIDDLSEHGTDADPKRGKDMGSGNVVALSLSKNVSCLPGLGRLDACLVLIIADVLKREGINACVATAPKSIEENQTSSVCLAYIEDVSAARIAHASRRLIRQAPEARIIVCLLGASTDPGDSALKTKHPVVRTLPEIVAAVKAKIHGSGAAASITEGIA
jgi:predicted PurR-regulated permease PerM